MSTCLPARVTRGSRTTTPARTGGAPQFSPHEKDAVARGSRFDAATGVQADEVHDIVNQVSVAWVEPLKKWVMFYGGGLTQLPPAVLPKCGVLQLFTGAECKDVGSATARCACALPMIPGDRGRRRRT